METEENSIEFDAILLLKSISFVEKRAIFLLLVPENKTFFHVLIKITEFSAVGLSECFFQVTVGNNMISTIFTAKKVEYFINKRSLFENKLICKYL